MGDKSPKAKEKAKKLDTKQKGDKATHAKDKAAVVAPEEEAVERYPSGARGRSQR